MKRERIIKIGILAVVFVLAIIGFSYLTNRGSSGATADMGNPTLPTISFEIGGEEVNVLVGHKKEMNVAAVRDAIIPFDDDGLLKAKVNAYGNKIGTLKYEILALDGEEKYREDTAEAVKGIADLKVSRTLTRDEEGILKITLAKGDENIYYYTRIVKNNAYHTEKCLNFAKQFHENALKKQQEDSIKKVLETNATSKNNTFSHVNIHSDLNHVMWGKLAPKLVQNPKVDITETKKAYTSIVLRYQVACEGDNNKEEIYNVKEFFKVLYKKDSFYLLEYDRTMEEVFDTSNVVLNSKGVLLGISKENASYKTSDDGTKVAFLQAGELWSYDKEKSNFSLLFSFADSENEDLRNRTDKHSVKIHRIDDQGNVTFSVCGYMNRGIHEGESGAAIYRYDISENTVEEKCFIPSTESYPVIEKEFTQFVFYNKDKKELYLTANDVLMKNEVVLLEGLSQNKFISSADGHLVAYNKMQDNKQLIEVWNLSEDTKWCIKPEEGQILIPLGFVGDDIVYGISSDELADKAMYRLEIREQNQKIIKVYEKTDSYILGVTVEDNVIKLRQAIKNGNEYRTIEDDYITNNETTNGVVSLKSYWTERKENQYRLEFAKGIKDKKAKTLRPKQVMQEKPFVLESKQEEREGYYYVYGHGEIAGVFEDTKSAVAVAEKTSGVVISPGQNYVWEADNRVAWYRNFKIDRFTVKDGENGLDACKRKVLSMEDEPEEIVTFQGNSVKDLFYLMDKGTPVIAVKDRSSAILLAGYDAKTVTYVDPMSGTVYTHNIEKVDSMLKESGNTFLAYVK